ncbi:MAG: hypothetical protein JSR38_20230 [Proteobacteria bacterium]|nr:hypothetical protein [Pseudomonadota bacterium]
MSRSSGRHPPASKPADAPIGRLRVAKRYGPQQAGAKRFTLRYGDQLVCVRHRLSDDGRVRHTTVELLIESTPIVSRQRSLIAIRIPATDRSTRQLLIACGAQWKPKERLWLLPHLIAKNLRLLKNRVSMSG